MWAPQDPGPGRTRPGPKTGQNRKMGISLSWLGHFRTYLYTFLRFLGLPDRSGTFLRPHWPILNNFWGPGHRRPAWPAGGPGEDPRGGPRGSKNREYFGNFFLLQITFKGSLKGQEPSKTQNNASGAPNWVAFGPILCVKRPFWPQKGPFWGQKTTFFSEKYFLFPITPGRSPEGLGPSNTQN